MTEHDARKPRRRALPGERVLAAFAAAGLLTALFGAACQQSATACDCVGTITFEAAASGPAIASGDAAGSCAAFTCGTPRPSGGCDVAHVSITGSGPCHVELTATTGATFTHHAELRGGEEPCPDCYGPSDGQFSVPVSFGQGADAGSDGADGADGE